MKIEKEKKYASLQKMLPEIRIPAGNPEKSDEKVQDEELSADAIWR